MNSTATGVTAPSNITAVPAPEARSEARHIVVQAGQSLSRIATEYGVPQRTIIAANQLTPPYKIKIGQQLLIPDPDEPLPAAVARREARHIVVQAGQSLSRIATEYSVPQRTIIAAKQLTPPYKIKIGQQLLIPGPDEPPPVPAVVGSPPSEVIPVAGPAPLRSTALPAMATSPATAPRAAAPASPGSPPTLSALKPFEVAATAGDKNAAPLHAPAAPAPTMTGRPPAPATTVAAPAPMPVSAAELPGVNCPPGTIGIWSDRDVTKIPVYICHHVHPQE